MERVSTPQNTTACSSWPREIASEAKSSCRAHGRADEGYVVRHTNLTVGETFKSGVEGGHRTGVSEEQLGTGRSVEGSSRPGPRRAWNDSSDGVRVANSVRRGDDTRAKCCRILQWGRNRTDDSRDGGRRGYAPAEKRYDLAYYISKPGTGLRRASVLISSITVGEL